MGLLQKLKGVFKNMISPKTLESVLKLTPTISTTMQTAIGLWEDMYMDKAPWLNDNVRSLGLPALIASEKARTATIEMAVKITGDNDRAKYIDEQFKKVLCDIRIQLEYGIALGGFVIKPYISMGPDGKYVMEFNYTKASGFYPLSFSPEGQITEAAFIDRMLSKDTVYSKLEYHKLEGNTLTVRNLAFKNKTSQLGHVNSGNEPNMAELGTPIPLSEVSAWANIAPEATIDNVDTMLFTYFKMPQANNVDLDSPLGVSGFSRAVDLIKEADKQYSNLLWEFEGGQLAVDVDRTALNPTRDYEGRTNAVLPKLQDRLYRRNLDLGNENTYNVFSPTLRDGSIINGLNAILTKIEDACFLSRGSLSHIQYTEARTATELKIIKQRSFSANRDIQKELEKMLRFTMKIIDKYCDLYDIVPSGEYEAAFCWDDSIIVDKDSERQQDLIEVKEGLMSKVEYRQKWYGETEDQASEELEEIDDEKQKALQLVQLSALANANAQNNNSNNSDNVTDAQAKQNKLERANDSDETTKN